MSEDRAMRVLHIAPTPFFSDRGCHIRIEGIVKALNKRNVDSLVCTYHHGRERPGIRTKRIGAIRNYQKTEPGPHPLKYLADLKLLWLVRKSIKQFDPDVIHAHLHEGALLGWFGKWLSFRPRLPLVADMQGSLVGELSTHGYFDRHKYLRPVFRIIEYAVLRLPQHVFCSSVSSLTMIKREYRLKGRHVTLLSDRVDIDLVATDIERITPKSTVTVLYSGSLSVGKGIAELKQVMAKLLERRTDVEVVVVGYPTAEIDDFVIQNGLRGRVKIAGQVHFDQLSSYLQAADIGLDPKLPGAGEGSGKILNYMAAGLPVVAFHSPNNREFLGDEQELVEDNSVEHFVRQIETLMDDPSLRRQEGARNNRRARDVLSWDAGADALCQTYNALLEPKKRDA